MVVSYKKVLVPLDGSHLAEKALDHAVALARGFGASVELLRVVPEVDALAQRATDQEQSLVGMSQDVILAQAQAYERTEAESYLERCKERLARDGLQVAGRVVVGGPADAILAESQDAADVIVLTAYGKTASLSAPAAGVFGGVADRVLRAARRPVLVVRP